MKLVIDIPEDRFEDIQRIASVQIRRDTVEKFIANGTPLPKGHGRLGDLDKVELLKDIEGQAERDGRTSSDVISKGVLEVFLDYIRNFPSARPVNETVEHDKGDLISREATIADLHTADIPDEWMAWIEHFVNVQPSVDPEQKGRDCASCKHSNNGECAYTEECHKCMWESQYERQVEPERKKGKWIWDKRTGTYHCSECGHDPLHEDVGEIEEYKYCMNCGAEMEVDG